ncbi:MAG: class I SAM-dependent methyltransferase [Nitrospinaceae bacterium]|jgi:SAM-dependent methyltransferase|nr:class I SAM-dependent methyltransferase [Nitrospinaceae bacterium]|tara:strand:- start:437 stop:961 length:525 start_codon:yes stop_codon:yes gene_type:complete
MPWLEKQVSCQALDFCKKRRQPKSGALLEQEISRYADEILSEVRVRNQIKLLKECYDADLKEKKVLEIGSGYATFLIGARLWEGINALGTEPARFQCDNLKLPKNILRAGGVEESIFFGAQGEQLPFRDGFLDVTYSHNALEHVDDPEKVLSEAFIILKPGGKMVIIAPNYFTF